MPISQWLKDSTLQNHFRSRCNGVDNIYSGFHKYLSFQSNTANVYFMNKFHPNKNSHSIERLLVAVSNKLKDTLLCYCKSYFSSDGDTPLFPFVHKNPKDR